MKKIIFIVFILAAIASITYFSENKPNPKQKISDIATSTKKIELSEPIDRIKIVPITEGSTFGKLMTTSSVPYALAMEIYDIAKPVYDLTKIRVERELELTFDKDTDELKKLIYRVDTENELHVSHIASSSIATSTWQAELIIIPYEYKTKTAEGIIESSLYQAALNQEIDIRAIIELANAFQWSIDFAMDPRTGDTFKFIYEERYLNGEYIMPGKILAGRYINAGKQFDVFYFEESKDNIGYFDADGNSVQKMFLKAPVAFKYISSGYTTGPRYVAAFKQYNSSHRAIDYAATLGTPIRSVGNGTVVYAGWNSSGYGNFVSIRHNGTYTTNYAHLSKIYVSYGQKVSQSDTIGAVGSTGYSTGPHLHYEMVKNGSKINPLNEILPPGKPIKEENKERFFAKIKEWQEILK
ncbi:MAG: peptidoglycan DD-metalloendopeptidase family protein [Patescibacteria group bacterium]|nr:peptidoglycan DD-metalloendopeptidase family protein [Patescibacteria group bacterium]